MLSSLNDVLLFHNLVSTTAPPSDSFPWLAIYLGLAFGFVLIITVVCLILGCVKKKDKNQEKSEPPRRASNPRVQQITVTTHN